MRAVIYCLIALSIGAVYLVIERGEERPPNAAPDAPLPRQTERASPQRDLSSSTPPPSPELQYPVVAAGQSSSEGAAVTAPRSQELSKMFAASPTGFAQRVDAYLLQSTPDSDWSLYAENTLKEWFGSDDPAETEDQVIVECVADACFMDLYVSAVDFTRKYGARARQWPPADASGFFAFEFLYL